MIKRCKFLILFILLFSTTLTADKNIFDKGVGFKEGIVHYRISGSESGIKTMYIKEYGKRRVIYTNTKSKFMKKNSTTDQMTHITPKWIYKINLETNTTTKLPNLKYLLFKRYLVLSKNEKKLIETNLKTLKNRSLQNLQSNKIQEIGKVVRHLCNIESINGVTTYTAQNSDLILKTETEILGFHTKTVATDIEKKSVNIKIFVLPKNLKIIPKKQKIAELNQKADQIIDYLLSKDIKLPQLIENKKLTSKKNDLQDIIQESILILDKL